MIRLADPPERKNPLITGDKPERGPSLSLPTKQELQERLSAEIQSRTTAPSHSELAEYVRLKAEANAIDRRLSALRRKLEAHALAQGGQAQRYGYRIALVPGAVRPSWKDAYERDMGSVAVSQIIAQTSPSLSLVVERS